VFNNIASGPSNGLLKICEFQNEESYHYPICVVGFISENLLISGSDDSVIKIWNITKKECIFKLYSKYGVKWLTVQESDYSDSAFRIISGCSCMFEDMDIVIWNIKINDETDVQLIEQLCDEQIIDESQGTLFGYQTIDEKHFVCGHSSGKIIIYDSDTFDVKIMIDKPKPFPASLSRCSKELNNHRIICGFDNGMMKIWKINDDEPQLDFTLKGHRDELIGIMVLSNGQIVSCSIDGKIKF
jgi:WD40 repeat protein